MGPFRPMSYEMCNGPMELIKTAIEKLVQGQSRKLFVGVTTGCDNLDSSQLASAAILEVTSTTPRRITPVPHSSWLIVKMNTPASVTKLLTQKLLINVHKHKNKMVVFCPIVQQNV